MCYGFTETSKVFQFGRTMEFSCLQITWYGFVNVSGAL